MRRLLVAVVLILLAVGLCWAVLPRPLFKQIFTTGAASLAADCAAR